MKTVSCRIAFKDLPDIFGPKELGQYLGIHINGAYELARSKIFPSIRVGKKILISKMALSHWMDEQSKE